MEYEPTNEGTSGKEVPAQPQDMFYSDIIGVKNLKSGEGIEAFFKRFYESDLRRDFGVYRLSLDVLRNDIQNYIIEHGISSLFYQSITCDEITHSGLHTDQIEAIVLGVMRKLDGVRHLLIVDPFFYDESPACLTLLEKIVAAMASRLEKVTLITNGKRTNRRAAMHNVFQKLVPAIQIKDSVSDEFHDRYWINLDSSKGVIVGTSLNGIGKKISMIDHAKHADSKEIDHPHPLQVA
ncbi:hypothetical protein RQP54_06810 [Curvibacter sp. APW13]|uniref:hypothetical protein n=1 Tax=Curvibacter sp. APW13 TaxID=3077236 RepID=UPI0028DF4390|nr:hypothetical protein [Curvibacter sp. APW13]MDT8990574.1 hypothetical protein [Curvibacter sp. APW13]